MRKSNTWGDGCVCFKSPPSMTSDTCERSKVENVQFTGELQMASIITTGRNGKCSIKTEDSIFKYNLFKENLESFMLHN